MKNTLRLIGIIALAVIIGFSMTACDPNNGDQNCSTCGKYPCECPPPCTTHTLGAAATCITAQICTECETVIQAALGHDESGADATCTTNKECARDNCSHVLQTAGHTAGICTRCGVLRLSGLDVRDDEDSGITEFTQVFFHTNNELLTDLITGTPKVQITEGKLTIEFDQPKSEHMQLADEVFWDTVAEPNDALVFSIYYFITPPYANPLLELRSLDWFQTAALIYADKDVVLNGNCWNNFDFNNLTLKRGWNYLILDWNNYSASSSQTHPEGFVWTIYND